MANWTNPTTVRTLLVWFVEDLLYNLLDASTLHDSRSKLQSLDFDLLKRCSQSAEVFHHRLTLHNCASCYSFVINVQLNSTHVSRHNMPPVVVVFSSHPHQAPAFTIIVSEADRCGSNEACGSEGSTAYRKKTFCMLCKTRIRQTQEKCCNMECSLNTNCCKNESTWAKWQEVICMSGYKRSKPSMLVLWVTADVGVWPASADWPCEQALAAAWECDADDWQLADCAVLWEWPWWWACPEWACPEWACPWVWLCRNDMMPMRLTKKPATETNYTRTY